MAAQSSQLGGIHSYSQKGQLLSTMVIFYLWYQWYSSNMFGMMVRGRIMFAWEVCRTRQSDDNEQKG